MERYNITKYDKSVMLFRLNNKLKPIIDNMSKGECPFWSENIGFLKDINKYVSVNVKLSEKQCEGMYEVFIRLFDAKSNEDFKLITKYLNSLYSDNALYEDSDLELCVINMILEI